MLSRLFAFSELSAATSLMSAMYKTLWWGGGKELMKYRTNIRPKLTRVWFPLAVMLKEFPKTLYSTSKNQSVVGVKLLCPTSWQICAQTTILFPCALINTVQRIDFFTLLEAQRIEHLLTDVIATSQPTSVKTRYYSQLLMTQQLQRALLEVELYAYAISEDGLRLVEGN